MGLVTALIFGAVRLILAVIPVTGRRWRTKRIAAVIALGGALAYLLLSGASVATQRAFFMAMVALIAIILNRPAITLRALAVAALVILVIRPESLVQVGFQMSFAATAAIIAGFDYARARGWTDRFAGGGRRAQISGYVVALIGTSLLAGLATAPFAAFHFNRIAHYGLLANLIAVPVMGFWVAPAALIAGVLLPLGLEAYALQVMGKGIEFILVVARFVAGLDGATSPVRSAPAIVLSLFTVGGLILCLGRSSIRFGGAAACLAAGLIWILVDTRPPVLVAPEGRLLGLMTDAGRALDHPKAQGYAAQSWLMADGDDADQETAATRGGFQESPGGSALMLENGWRIANVLDRSPLPAELTELCQPQTLILAPNAVEGRQTPCLMLAGEVLVAQGALAIWPREDGLRILTVRETIGDRHWSRTGTTEDTGGEVGAQGSQSK
jgi:competence protein ComEC